jgi:hypothetical protein
MKRSHHVSAPLLAAAALALTTGCRKPQMQRCVDEKNQVVADNLCQNQPLQQQQQRSGSSGGYVPMYRYYYGGGGGYNLGTPVTGGTYSPTPGTSYSNSTTRGGFGSSSGESGSGHGGSSSGGGE